MIHALLRWTIAIFAFWCLNGVGERAIILNLGPDGKGVIRLDAAGNALDAHAGEIVQIGSRFFLFGDSYGCGFGWFQADSPFCGFRSYVSDDLVRWRDNGPLFDASTPLWQKRCGGGRGCFRPHVLYNARTKTYVLWINDGGVPPNYRVFTSIRPEGPYVERPLPRLAVNETRNPRAFNGDFGLFVDRDGTGYIAYTDYGRSGDIVIEQLDAGYTSGTGRYVRANTSHVESPALFERDGTYYLVVSDPNCGYCNGTGTSYFHASAPLGRWTGAGQPWRTERGTLVLGKSYPTYSLDGAQWTDYDFSFALETRDATTWYFRAPPRPSGTDGYAWTLVPAANGRGAMLEKRVTKDYSTRDLGAIRLTYAGGRHRITMRMAGTTISTIVDGHVVDRMVDATFSGGRVGFSSAGSARIMWMDVTTPSGRTLLLDDFGAGLSQWGVRERGISISGDSCGGQPAAVSRITVAERGSMYLYQVDLWNDYAVNEGLGDFYWAPLEFGTSGSIEPIACGASWAAPWRTTAGAPQTLQPLIGIARSDERAQGIRIEKDATAVDLGFTAFVRTPALNLSDEPTAPLDVTLFHASANGPVGPPVATTPVKPSQIAWSPTTVTIRLAGNFSAGLYDLVFSSASSNSSYGVTGLYGGNPASLVSHDGGRSWSPDQHYSIPVKIQHR